jgi:hypothetical protein
MVHIQRGVRLFVRRFVPGSAATRQTVTAAFRANHNATPVQTNVIVMMPPSAKFGSALCVICLNP